MKKKGFLLILIVFGLLCACATSILYITEDVHKTTLSSQSGVYKFDSQSIIQDIALGKTDLFFIIPNETDYATPIPNLPPVKFTSSAYLQVIDAFDQHLSEKMANQWKYNIIDYSLDCKDVYYGPQEAYFHIVKSLSSDSQIRVDRLLYIYPYRNRVEWEEFRYDTDEFIPTFDYSEVKVSVEEALEIAEDYGGKMFRHTENNHCLIALSISGRHEMDYWKIRYIGNGKSFEILVDKKTGTAQVIGQGEGE